MTGALAVVSSTEARARSRRGRQRKRANTDSPRWIEVVSGEVVMRPTPPRVVPEPETPRVEVTRYGLGPATPSSAGTTTKAPRAIEPTPPTRPAAPPASMGPAPADGPRLGLAARTRRLRAVFVSIAASGALAALVLSGQERDESDREGPLAAAPEAPTQSERPQPQAGPSRAEARPASNLSAPTQAHDPEVRAVAPSGGPHEPGPSGLRYEEVPALAARPPELDTTRLGRAPGRPALASPSDEPRPGQARSEVASRTASQDDATVDVGRAPRAGRPPAPRDAVAPLLGVEAPTGAGLARVSRAGAQAGAATPGVREPYAEVPPIAAPETALVNHLAQARARYASVPPRGFTSWSAAGAAMKGISARYDAVPPLAGAEQRLVIHKRVTQAPTAGVGLGAESAGEAVASPRFYLQSTPPGAEVYVDGHRRGRTPLALDLEPPGPGVVWRSLEILFVHPEYLPESLVLEPASSGRLVNVPLRRASPPR